MEKLVFGDLYGKQRALNEERYRAAYERRVMAAMEGLRAAKWPGGGPSSILAYPRHLRQHGLDVLRAAAIRIEAGPPCRRCGTVTQEGCMCAR